MGWSDAARRLCEARRSATFVVRRMTNFRVHSALNGWKAHHARIQYLSRVLKRIRSVLLAHAFDGWADALARMNRQRAVVVRFVARMRHQHEYQAFATWRHLVSDLHDKLINVDHKLRLFQHSHMLRAWNGFVHVTRSW